MSLRAAKPLIAYSDRPASREHAMDNEIGEFWHLRPLARLRYRRGVNQDMVAELLGVPRQNVSRLETQIDPRVSTVARYLAALDGRAELHAVFDGLTVPLLATLWHDRLPGLVWPDELEPPPGRGRPAEGDARV